MRIWLLAALTLAGQLPAGAQATKPITSERHYRLSFQNQYVRVYQLEVAPGESTQVYPHDYDSLLISIGEAQITVSSSATAEKHLMHKDGEIRFSRGGFAHAVRNDGARRFRAVAVEFLGPQSKPHNLCLQVIANEPLACHAAAVAPATASTHTDQPAFEADETRVTLISVKPKQEMRLRDSEREELLVSLDQAVIGFAEGKGPERLLHPGDLVWIGRGGVTRVFKNASAKEARFFLIEMKSRKTAKPEKGSIIGAPLAPKKP